MEEQAAAVSVRDDLRDDGMGRGAIVEKVPAEMISMDRHREESHRCSEDDPGLLGDDRNRSVDRCELHELIECRASRG